MPFQFTCPYCFKKTLVEDRYAGQAGPCVSCGKMVTLPRLKTEGSSAQSPCRAQPPLPSPALPSGLFASLLSKVRSPWISAGLLSVVIFIGVWIVWQIAIGMGSLAWVQKVHQRQAKAGCLNNLSRIAKALNEYAANHGAYPPPVVYDENGKPMHSWRVLILRELGEFEIYNRYRFDEPWDSERNSELVGRLCPRVYVSPGANDFRNVSYSNYFLIVGDGGLFPSQGQPLSPSSISDGSGNTLLVVEGANLFHEWTQPIDIDIANWNQPGATKISLGGTHADGSTAALADGSTVWLPDDMAPEALKGLISANGGEPVDSDAYRP